MRYIPYFACLLLFVFGISTTAAQETYEQVAPAAEPAPIVLTPELVQAHQEYQLALLRWRQYRFVELPRQRRLLSAQLRTTETELRVLRRRQRDYRPFLQVGQYSPVRTAAENESLTLLDAEANLRELKHERINLMRYSPQTSQLYQLDVLRAALRVSELLSQSQAKTK